MKIIFSPTKTQKIQKNTGLMPTNILFPEKTDFLVKKMQKRKVSDFHKKMKISDKLAQQAYDAYKNFDKVQTSAMHSFSGTTFLELSLSNYSKTDWNFAQKNVCILSALYGILRPLDAVSVYRLDMNDTLLKPDVENLYAYWADSIENYFKKESCIINLASTEYSKMLSKKILNKTTTIHFLVLENMQYKNVSMYAKKQRGKILEYIIKNNITKIEQIYNHISDGFVYDAEKSDKQNIYFIRKTI